MGCLRFGLTVVPRTHCCKLTGNCTLRWRLPESIMSMSNFPVATNGPIGRHTSAICCAFSAACSGRNSVRSMVAFLNGLFVPEEQAVVSIFDRSFLYGDGLFEAIRILNGAPFRWQQHLDRLQRGAEFKDFN